MDNKSDNEDKNDGDDDHSGRYINEDRIDKEENCIATEDQSKDLDPDLKEDGQMEKSEVRLSDEDDDSETEFVTLTHPTGDAWTSGLHSCHTKGPVLPKEISKEKKTEVTGTDTTKRKLVHKQLM